MRRVRSAGTETASRRISAATRARSSSVRSPKDFVRSTSVPLATMRMADSSSDSSTSSSSPIPCHSAAVVPTVISRSAGCSPQSGSGRWPAAGIVSSMLRSSLAPIVSHQSSKASS